jgi:hypothetical protein
VQWDEFTDLVIAADTLRDPLVGSFRDPSQARLPMYVTAAAYRITQWLDPTTTILDVLPVSRWISIAMTVLAIWATAVLGYQLFDGVTALLAASLFTFSPLVLHFGKDALTQGDAFTPALVTCALVGFVSFEHRRTTWSLFLSSVGLGLAIAAKFTLVALVPALMMYTLLRAGLAHGSGKSPDAGDHALPADERRAARRFIVTAVATGSFALLAVGLSIAGAERTGLAARLGHIGALTAWVAALLGLAGTAIIAMPGRGVPSRRMTRATDPWSAVWLWAVILPLAAAVTLALFPSHIFNPDVVLGLIDRAATRDGGNELLPTALASARLYAGLLLFKLGVPFGVVTWLALGWALARSPQHRGLLLTSVTLSWYALLLLLLPLQQPFWLMSVYPLLTLVLSAAITHHLQPARSWPVRVTAAAVVVLASVWLGFGVARVYPTFGFYGYETVGDRWLGESSRGYRSLVVVTNDGTTVALA